jgi:hypothetical protein
MTLRKTKNLQRKRAKRYRDSNGFLCGFAPLREKSSLQDRRPGFVS